MTVDLKSHVLRRNEKGFFGIPFKRLLASGMAGGMTLVTTQNISGSAFSFVMAVAVALGTLIMTASRGGVPLWKRLIYGFQARLIRASVGNNPIIAQFCALLKIAHDSTALDGAQLFSSHHTDQLTRPQEWIVFANLDDHGLALVDTPSGAGK